MFVSIGVVILDDIVLPDGRTQMGVLGGGATHAAMGMRLWEDRVGLLVTLGNDFPPDLEAQLRHAFLPEGLLHRSYPVLRAWQVFEADGTRHEVFRVDSSWVEQSVPAPEDWPSAFQDVQGVHLHCAPWEVPRWATFLRGQGVSTLLWEPWDAFCVPQNRERFAEYLGWVDIVSPNLGDGQALTGRQSPHEVMSALLAMGAKVVALRMGAQGSLVGKVGEEFIAIPPVSPACIVDVTGAGNAYCGGFLVGWVQQRNLRWAGYLGAVSASMALEQFGALYDWEEARPRALERLRQLTF